MGMPCMTMWPNHRPMIPFKNSPPGRLRIQHCRSKDWSLLNKIEHKHPAYRQLLGYDPKTSADSMEFAKMTDVSPISFVTNDDPPVMQVHGDKDDIVPIRTCAAHE